MPKQRFTLDSCVVIKHLNHELDLEDFFSGQGEYEICVSVITFMAKSNLKCKKGKA
jgi:hypothetical protein